MKTSTLALAVCIGLLVAAPAMFSQTRRIDPIEELRAAVTRLNSEVRSLRAELLRLQIETSQQRLQKSEDELNDATQEQQRLDEEDRSLAQQLQELDAQLLQPSLPPEARAELVQAKFDAETSETATLREERALADRRESIAWAAFDQARKAHSQLLERAVGLGVANPNERGR